MMIFHLVTKSDWQRSRKIGTYTPPSLEKDGYIHACHKDQILSVANALFAGIPDLLVLVIDTDEIEKKLIKEKKDKKGEKHPHIYGPISIDAVVNVQALKPNKEGIFTVLTF